MVPGMPFDCDRVDALLDARGAKALPGGGRSWLLEHGSVELHPLREGGQWIATEVRVPLLDHTELMRDVVAQVLDLAKQAEVRLFDPQLGREVTSPHDSSLMEQYQRTAHYASEMTGLASAMPISSGEDAGFQPTTKMALGILGFFTLLYFVMRFIDGRLHGN